MRQGSCCPSGTPPLPSSSATWTGKRGTSSPGACRATSHTEIWCQRDLCCRALAQPEPGSATLGRKRGQPGLCPVLGARSHFRVTLAKIFSQEAESWDIHAPGPAVSGWADFRGGSRGEALESPHILPPRVSCRPLPALPQPRRPTELHLQAPGQQVQTSVCGSLGGLLVCRCGGGSGSPPWGPTDCSHMSLPVCGAAGASGPP